MQPINNFGINNAGQQPVYSSQARGRETTPPQVEDHVDFNNGANNPVELSLLPSVDLIIGQLASRGIEEGKAVKVEGQVTEGDDNKKLASVNYEMKMDQSSGALETKGYFLADAENGKGTYINEKSVHNPSNPFLISTTGSVSTDKDSTEPNEVLNTQINMNVFSKQGQINGFNVEEQMALDYTGAFNMQGNLAGTPFMRRAVPDFMTGGTTIQGKMGDMPETGQAVLSQDGGYIINRQIGPYKVSQKVSFTTPAPEQPPA